MDSEIPRVSISESISLISEGLVSANTGATFDFASVDVGIIGLGEGGVDGPARPADPDGEPVLLEPKGPNDEAAEELAADGVTNEEETLPSALMLIDVALIAVSLVAAGAKKSAEFLFASTAREPRAAESTATPGTTDFDKSTLASPGLDCVLDTANACFAASFSASKSNPLAGDCATLGVSPLVAAARSRSTRSVSILAASALFSAAMRSCSIRSASILAASAFFAAAIRSCSIRSISILAASAFFSAKIRSCSRLWTSAFFPVTI